MPSIPLRVKGRGTPDTDRPANHLPTLLQTPSGLAILEIQGTIHAPFPDQSEDDNAPSEPAQTPVGHLDFPLYNPQTDPGDTKWMKRVYLYVGRHQRLTGEVKKLPKSLVVVSKRSNDDPSDVDRMEVDGHENPDDELEILEVVKYKLLFGGRPEPVGN